MNVKKIKKIICPPDKWYCRKQFLIPASLLILSFIILYSFKWSNNYPNNTDLVHEPDFFGVTFSTKFCEEIGLDWREVYLATLDDLEVREIRLPIYWDEIEKTSGVYDFSNYDYIIEEGEKRGVNFIVNIGWRLSVMHPIGQTRKHLNQLKPKSLEC